MSRPMIHCPACGRELYQLRRAQCVWCGERISQDLFEQVSRPPGAVTQPLPQPLPPMPPPGVVWSGRAWGSFDRNPFSLIKRSVSPWERRLRIVGAGLFVCLTVARLGEIAWNFWRMSHLIPHVR